MDNLSVYEILSLCIIAMIPVVLLLTAVFQVLSSRPGFRRRRQLPFEGPEKRHASVCDAFPEIQKQDDGVTDDIFRL